MQAPPHLAAQSRLLAGAIVAAFPPGAHNRPGRRFVQLVLGLLLYGVSLSCLVLGHSGLDPWDVFQQGLALHTGIAIGTWPIIVGIAVLVLWLPLHQRPGLGTLLNATVIGAVKNVSLGVVASPQNIWLRGSLTAVQRFIPLLQGWDEALAGFLDPNS